MPIDPSFSIGGPEWQIGGVGSVGGADGATQSGSGFGDMLGKAIDSVEADQENACALATGQASDPTAVVMAVERAQLSMQLASQIRTKVVEAAQDIFHTQV
jgi:flagellar hook-basal body complex protein FliE